MPYGDSLVICETLCIYVTLDGSVRHIYINLLGMIAVLGQGCHAGFEKASLCRREVLMGIAVGDVWFSFDTGGKGLTDICWHAIMGMKGHEGCQGCSCLCHKKEGE